MTLLLLQVLHDNILVVATLVLNRPITNREDISMVSRRINMTARLTGALLVVFCMTISAYAQSGHVMNGAGPVDQSMSGAGMAAPRDAQTALHWNPAALFTVPGTSLDISLQYMMPSSTITSSVQAGAFGPAFGPPVTMEGTTDSDIGGFPIPTFAFAKVDPESKLAWGVSAVGVGGFGVDYAMSASNPILTPQMPQGGMGFGAVESTFMLLQVSPTVAYKLKENIWIGFSPTYNMASLELSVFPATPPQFIDVFSTPSVGQDDLPLYPDAPAEWAIGFGFQAGIHAVLENDISIGVSFKSKQSFSDFEYSPTTPGASDYTFQMDFPMIVSGAISYTGVENLMLAADVRYIDYANTAGFDDSGFDAQMAVKGFGWDAITVVAVGAEYMVKENLPVRFGYSWNSSPIGEDVAFFNSPAPALVMQRISAGFSFEIKEGITASFAGQYGLKGDVEGEWKSPMFPGGTSPGTSVKHELSTLTMIGGVHITL